MIYGENIKHFLEISQKKNDEFISKIKVTGGHWFFFFMHCNLYIHKSIIFKAGLTKFVIWIKDNINLSWTINGCFALSSQMSMPLHLEFLSNLYVIKKHNTDNSYWKFDTLRFNSPQVIQSISLLVLMWNNCSPFQNF